MFQIFRLRNFYIVFVVDVLSVIASLLLAYAIRFEFQPPGYGLIAMVRILPGILIIKIITFFLFGLYHGMWRYTSVEDIISVFKAAFVSTLSIVFLILMISRFQGYPRSVFIIDWFLTFFLISGTRLGIRLFYEANAGIRFFPFFVKGKTDATKLLIVGAGYAGEKVVREILDNPALRYVPIGFLDDDPRKHGKTIHGVSVIGSINLLESSQAMQNLLFDEILLALPSLSGRHMRRIVSACEETRKPFRTVPALKELINGNISMKLVRNVTIQDLLNREEVHLDEEGISAYLYQKRVLVTGAGGSIGSELVRQIGRFHPEALALVEMSEFNLFQVEKEAHRRFNGMLLTGFLSDIRNLNAVRRIFKEFQPQVVFHAAAYKHVPLQELHPWEAVRNNVLGSKNLIRVAQECEVEKFVLVSTDKAVRPTNVMGATKRVAEKLIASANQHPHSQFMAVRFGNVIGSSGSVIPLFQEQIEQGGPVTVTHPDVIRYFMSIPEAAQLILEAGAMGRGGEIFILDMGDPVRIIDLARDLIRLHGYEPEQDIAIQYVGLRPGEKLYEELITEGEGIVKTNHEKIMVLRGDTCDAQILQHQVDNLLEISATYNASKIKQTLKAIVSEYTPAIFEN